MARRVEPGDLSLDQVRAFVAVVDHGGFSAAGRALGRVQSAVSHAVAALEGSLGLRLFDRSGYRPTLTPDGAALVPRARLVLQEAQELAATASALGGTVEDELALVVDAIASTEAVVAFARRFEVTWPRVRLRLETEALSAVLERVRAGACDLGVANADLARPGLDHRPMGEVTLIPVVAAAHPLASTAHPLRRAELAAHRQIVLSGRGPEALEPDRGVLAPLTWRVLDLESKQAWIEAGLGWGTLPAHRAGAALAAGRLVRLPLAREVDVGGTLRLACVWDRGARLGPAARWSIEALVSPG